MKNTKPMKVARIAGEHDVVDIALATRAQIDHFPDVRKMVVGFIPRDFAGCFGFVNDIQKVFQLAVAQKMLNFPGQPIFHTAFGLLRMPLEGVGEVLDLLSFSITSTPHELLNQIRRA